jgi:hypothetical protein
MSMSVFAGALFCAMVLVAANSAAIRTPTLALRIDRVFELLKGRLVTLSPMKISRRVWLVRRTGDGQIGPDHGGATPDVYPFDRERDPRHSCQARRRGRDGIERVVDVADAEFRLDHDPVVEDEIGVDPQPGGKLQGVERALAEREVERVGSGLGIGAATDLVPGEVERP